MKRLRIAAAAAAFLTLCAPAAHAAQLKVLYAFKGGTDGTNPVASVTPANGTLYGATQGGGATGCGGFGCGTVFRIDPATGTETVLYRFTNSPDAASPSGPLLLQGTRLYGTTLGGGRVFPGDGAAFAIDTATGAETLLGSLGGATGQQSYSGLAFVSGGLYGAALLGGTGFGTLFQVNRHGGLTPVYTFAGPPNDGTAPTGTLPTHDGLIYGTTRVGGQCLYAGGCGTLFQFNPATGQEKLLHVFTGADGTEPSSLLYYNGRLFGVAEGGANPACVPGCGTVFELDLATGAFSTLYAFKGGDTDGETPDGLTILHGILYGTTAAGGPPNAVCQFGCGTLFAYNPATRQETVPVFFTSLQAGFSPQGLTAAGGVLYGTTTLGGDPACEGGSGCGVVFAYTPP